MTLIHTILPLLSLLTQVAYGVEGNLYYRLFQATDASHDSGFLLNPAKNPSSAKATKASGASQGTLLVVMSGRDTKVENSSNGQSTSSNVEDFSVAGSLMLNAGAGLTLTLNGEHSISDVVSSRMGSNNDQLESLKDTIIDGRLSVVLTEMFALGITIKSQRLDYNLKGNLFLSEDEVTAYTGMMIGPGYGFKGTIPLGSLIKQVDYGVTFIEPLKGKSEVNGEQFVIFEPSVLELGASFVISEFLVGLSYREWGYNADDRYFGTIYPNDDASDVDLFGLDPQRNSIFPLRNIQLGLDYDVLSNATIRASYAYESAEVSFNPGATTPEFRENGDYISYNSFTVGGSYTHSGLEMTGVMKVTNLANSLEQNQNISLSGSSTELIFSVASSL